MTNDWDALFKEGLGLHQAGRIDEAERRYRAVLSAIPLHPWAWHYLGLIELQRGQTRAALHCLHVALVIEPSFAVFHGNLGETLVAADLDAAARCYRRAICCEPMFSSAYGNLVARCRHTESSETLLRFARRHVVLEPNSGSAQSNLGLLLSDRGALDAAETVLIRAVSLAPGSSEILANLGRALVVGGKIGKAIMVLERALRLSPDTASSYNNLGRAYQRAGRTGDGWTALRRALALRPDEAEALNNLGNVSLALGDAEGAKGFVGRSLALSPGCPAFRGNYVMALLYAGSTSAAELRVAAGREVVSRRKARGSGAAFASGSKSGLRLGFVSADLCSHPVGETLLSVIEAIDRREAEVYLYANVARPDEVSERFASLSDGWRLIADRSDDEVVSDVRRDGIDVLVSVAGHTAGGRLPVFASRAAPVQASLYDLTTTGLAEMDYWIGDEATTPVGTPELFSETILRLPCWYVFRRPPAEPPVSTVPALASGRVTFGCFNNPAKLSPSTLSTWAAVMQAVPGSRLLLKYLHFYEDQSLRAHIRSSFARSGVSADRIEFEVGSMAGSAHLSIYHHVDIALDPFPFVGCNATFQALWMGVPVVTLAGERFIARMGAGFLPLVGLGRLVAADHRSYVDIAEGLANDLPALAALRANLRDRVIASPLCDAQNYAKSLVAALRAG